MASFANNTNKQVAELKEKKGRVGKRCRVETELPGVGVGVGGAELRRSSRAPTKGCQVQVIMLAGANEFIS